MTISSRVVAAAAVFTCIAAFPPGSFAWGARGHEIINRLAFENLPQDTPAFLRTPAAIQMAEYMGPEPDRWRDKREAELDATQAADHFIDMEQADAIGEYPRNRYDYVQALERKYPGQSLAAEHVGMLPWQTEEVWQRLKADFREYRALRAAQKNTAAVEAVILYEAGWLGHYVGDGSQPMHTSVNYDGWTGDNPHAYTTAKGIHALFETTYVDKHVQPEQVAALVRASAPKHIGDEWPQFLSYLRQSQSLVEAAYALEKSGDLSHGSREATAFVNGRLAAAAIEFRDLLYSAWLQSGE